MCRRTSQAPAKGSEPKATPAGHRPSYTNFMADRLNSGESLRTNDALTSPNGEHVLRLQPDGYLVLYEADSQPVWASQTDGQDVATATMQDDGNLVLYSSGGDPAWASQTNGHAGSILVLQDDRNLVIYAADGDPLWATDTSI